jgi:uncharacterized membrane protein
MPNYQRTANVRASSDALFDYLSDVQNLPKYFSRMTSAKSAGTEEVHVTANVHGKQVEGKAEFHVDKAGKKIRWSSEGPNDYHGELEVTGQGNTSEVAVKLHTNRGEREEIERGLQETLNNIVRLVEQDATKAA